MSLVKGKEVFPHLALNTTFSWFVEEWREHRKLQHTGGSPFSVGQASGCGCRNSNDTWGQWLSATARGGHSIPVILHNRSATGVVTLQHERSCRNLDAGGWAQQTNSHISVVVLSSMGMPSDLRAIQWLASV